MGAVEYALEDIGCRTSEPFIEALSDKDDGVRSGAAWILGNIKDVRWLAVAALGDIGDERAIDPISMVPTSD